MSTAVPTPHEETPAPGDPSAEPVLELRGVNVVCFPEWRSLNFESLARSHKLYPENLRLNG